MDRFPHTSGKGSGVDFKHDDPTYTYTNDEGYGYGDGDNFADGGGGGYGNGKYSGYNCKSYSKFHNEMDRDYPYELIRY